MKVIEPAETEYAGLIVFVCFPRGKMAQIDFVWTIRS